MIEDGRPIPEEFVAPDLELSEITLIDAWGELVGDRYTEMGSIPFASIDRWAVRNGIDDPDDFAFVVRAVRAADQAYLAWAAEELKPRHPPPPQERRG